MGRPQTLRRKILDTLAELGITFLYSLPIAFYSQNKKAILLAIFLAGICFYSHRFLALDIFNADYEKKRDQWNT